MDELQAARLANRPFSLDAAAAVHQVLDLEMQWDGDDVSLPHRKSIKVMARAGMCIALHPTRPHEAWPDGPAVVGWFELVYSNPKRRRSSGVSSGGSRWISRSAFASNSSMPAASQMRAVWSPLAVTMNLPSGLYAADQT